MTAFDVDALVAGAGPVGLSAALAHEVRAPLDAQGIARDERKISTLEADKGAAQALVFADGTSRLVGAVYVQPEQRPRGVLPNALSLERTEAGHVAVGDDYRTSVPNVFACGDVTTPMQAVQMAAASGFAAAAFLNHTLIASGVHYEPAAVH